MSAEILCYEDGSEGLSDEAHLFQAKVLPYSLQIPDEVGGSQECRVGELGAPAASLIIEDDYAILRQRLEVRADVVDACAWPTVNHHDRIVAGSGYLVEDPGAPRAGHIAFGRYSWSLMPATNRCRDENSEEEKWSRTHDSTVLS
jgi:hypothetical protein